MPLRTIRNVWAAQLVLFTYVVNSVSPIERLSLELGAGRMIRTVDRRVTGYAAAPVALRRGTLASQRNLSIGRGNAAVG